MKNGGFAQFNSFFRTRPDMVIAVFYCIILLVCFHPLVLGHATLKWDAFRLWLPWKHFIVEELFNGTLPLWNPFMNNGFPQHGDTMTWYPVSWIIGGVFGGYNLSALNTEYLLHLFLAGFGFYSFSNTFNSSRKVRFLLGLSYMLCGVMIGNAQHMAWIISAAWLPWYMHSLFVLIRSFSYFAFLRFSLIGFLLFSGGYLAMFFVVFYCSIVYVGWFVFIHRRTIFPFLPLLRLSFAVLLIAVLSAPLLYSFYEIFPLFNRSNPEGSIDINLGGTPLNGIVALLLPFASGIFNVSEFEFGTFSSFFGTIPLLGVLFLSFQKNASKKGVTLLVIGVFFLFCSLSDHLPFRSWISHLPLLNLFRYPSLFRLFFIFFALWAFGELLQKSTFHIVNLSLPKTGWMIGLTGLLFLLIGFFCMSQSTDSFRSGFARIIFSEHRYPVDIWFRLGFNFFIICFASFLLLAARSIWKKKYLYITLLSFWAVELIFVAALAAPHVIYEPVHVAAANRLLDAQPNETPNPLANHQELEETEWKGYADFAWEGKTIFFKQFSGLWFNPLSIPSETESTICIPNNYPLYGIIDERGQQVNAVVDFNVLSNQHWRVSVLDSVSNSWMFYIKQHHVPDWGVSKGAIHTSQEGFMLISLNDFSQFDLQYSSSNYWKLFWVFLLFFSLTIIGFIVFSHQRILYGIALAILIGCCSYNFVKRTPFAAIDSSEAGVTNPHSHLIDTKFWNELPNTILLFAKETRTDDFIHTLEYYYPNYMGIVSVESGQNVLLFEKAPAKRHVYLEFDLPAFQMNGYAVDLTEVIKRRPLIHSAPYIVLEYTAQSNTTARLWVTLSKNNEWIKGWAIPLNSSLSDETLKRIVSRIDLTRYAPQQGEEVKLFLWGEGEFSDIQVKRLAFER